MPYNVAVIPDADPVALDVTTTAVVDQVEMKKSPLNDPVVAAGAPTTLILKFVNACPPAVNAGNDVPLYVTRPEPLVIDVTGNAPDSPLPP
jgi:hypothetical protein